MHKQVADAGAPSVYKFVANVKEYTLLESIYGTYQIIKDSKPVAHPATEEDAWQRIRLLSGRSNPAPQCWVGCSLHNCIDCERYYD
jgi:hypothetical protein